MSKYSLVPLTEMADVFDHLREPVSQVERNKKIGRYPYYGATGQIGLIDGYRQDGKYVLLGEDGAPFLDPNKPKAYIVEGKCWVNNHAHVLKGKKDICDDDFLCIALNYADYSNAVTGSTRLKLPQNMMDNLLIPNPSYDEQKAIAKHFLSQIQEIEKAREATEKTRQDLQAISNKQQQRALEILDELPRVPLSEYLVNIEAGKSIKTTELLAKKDELGVLKVSAVSWDRFQPDEAKSVIDGYIPPDEHRVKKGDLIITRANGTLRLVGSGVLVEEDYPNRLLSDKTLRLNLKDNLILPEYILLMLKLPEARKFIEENATGSQSMRNISQKTIYKIPIPKADKKQQKEIVELMQLTRTELRNGEAALKLMLADLDLLPNKLLQEAFNEIEHG